MNSAREISLWYKIVNNYNELWCELKMLSLNKAKDDNKNLLKLFEFNYFEVFNSYPTLFISDLNNLYNHRWIELFTWK